jgi:hypothetical protein
LHPICRCDITAGGNSGVVREELHVFQLRKKAEIDHDELQHGKLLANAINSLEALAVTQDFDAAIEKVVKVRWLKHDCNIVRI